MIKSHTIPYYRAFGGDSLPLIAPLYMRLKGLTFDHDVTVDMSNWRATVGEDLQLITAPNLKIINIKNSTNLGSAFRDYTGESLVIDKIECDASNFYSMCNNTKANYILVKGSTNASSVDLRYCFEFCRTVPKIEFLVDIPNISTCQQMFHGCYAVQYIDISGLTITASTTITNMFQDVPTTCTILVKDTSTAIILKNAFPSYTFTVKEA